MKTLIKRNNEHHVTVELTHQKITAQECESLQDIFASLGEQFSYLTLDMRDVSVVDPQFFLVLVRTIRDTAVKVTLVDVQDHIRRIVELSRLYTLFPIMPAAPMVAVEVESEVNYGSAA